MTVIYSDYYKKLAEREPLSGDEIVALLKHAEHFEKATGYLASCHAATAESLPKSASKSARDRMLSICKTAAQLLRGQSWGIRHQSKTEWEIERCERVAEVLERELKAAAESKAARAPSAGGM